MTEFPTVRLARIEREFKQHDHLEHDDVLWMIERLRLFVIDAPREPKWENTEWNTPGRDIASPSPQDGKGKIVL